MQYASPPTRRHKDYHYAVDVDCHLRHRAPAAPAAGPVPPGPHRCGRSTLTGPGRCALLTPETPRTRQWRHSLRACRHSAGQVPRGSLLAGALGSSTAGADALLHYGHRAVVVTRAGSRDSRSPGTADPPSTASGRAASAMVIRARVQQPRDRRRPSSRRQSASRPRGTCDCHPGGGERARRRELPDRRRPSSHRQSARASGRGCACSAPRAPRSPETVISPSVGQLAD